MNDEIALIKSEYEATIAQMRQDNKEEIEIIQLLQDNLKQGIQFSPEKNTDGLSKDKDDFAKELIEINKKCKQDLHELDVYYTAQIKKIKAEDKAEIEEIKQKSEDDAQKAAEKLAKEMKEHKEKRLPLKSPILQLIEGSHTKKVAIQIKK